jgi:hypothetical protein
MPEQTNRASYSDYRPYYSVSDDIFFNFAELTFRDQTPMLSFSTEKIDFSRHFGSFGNQHHYDWRRPSTLPVEFESQNLTEEQKRLLLEFGEGLRPEVNKVENHSCSLPCRNNASLYNCYHHIYFYVIRT